MFNKGSGRAAGAYRWGPLPIRGAGPAYTVTATAEAMETLVPAEVV
jgi:hypothetical protein